MSFLPKRHLVVRGGGMGWAGENRGTQGGVETGMALHHHVHKS